ncbi:MAG: PEPxxWA-CTERM sorting domain-containing protein [Pseudomonadota bacterium]
MRSLSMVLLGVLAFVATPQAASAQTVTFSGSSSTDGTDGNIRAFTVGNGIQGQASAWSIDGSTLEQAYLGLYSNGLGVTNNNEGNGSTSATHATDNYGQSDFILLVFNQAVNISSARLTPYDVSSTPNDNDALVAYANFALPFTMTPTPVALNSGLWAALAATDYNVAGNMTAPNWTSLNSTGLFGNAWIIGASWPNLDANDDGFKLTAINVTAAVPEPSTWAMMLIGFGGIGVSMRRRRKTEGTRLQAA